jgi:ABC-type transport system involved in multi-copper enzyme maturation permease subunit
MGVFSGIEVLFFFLGVITTCGIGGIVYLKKQYNADHKSLLLSGSGLFFFVFFVAWSCSSVLENEHQAANMGFVFFGLPAILLFGIAWKQLRKVSIAVKQ